MNGHYILASDMIKLLQLAVDAVGDKPITDSQGRLFVGFYEAVNTRTFVAGFGPYSITERSFMEKLWVIWEEGYLCSGCEGIPSPAHLVAVVRATTFKEACILHYGKDPYFSAERLTYWGCRLFDNEADARKEFG
jgi:hypothetical protein